MGVYIGDSLAAEGEGQNKKEAAQSAAGLALSSFNWPNAVTNKKSLNAGKFFSTSLCSDVHFKLRGERIKQCEMRSVDGKLLAGFGASEL